MKIFWKCTSLLISGVLYLFKGNFFPQCIIIYDIFKIKSFLGEELVYFHLSNIYLKNLDIVFKNLR